jgi:hypothetical protein
VDIRETRGHLGKRAHLRHGLQEGADPILALFLRFFPMQMYEEHMEVLARKQKDKEDAPGSRHNVKWDKGTFLKFLGLLIRFTIQPLPNFTWHWRWPHEVPEIGLKDVRHIMREVEFKRYWQKACVPGVDEPEEGEGEVDTKSPEY